MKLGTQLWALITVVVVIALVAGGYFLGVAPLLEQRALAESARQAAAAQNQALQSEIARLDEAAEDLDKYQELAAEFAELVPGSVDSQQFIRSLDALAASTGVTITKISIESFIPYEAPVADPAAEVFEGAPPPFTDSRINSSNFVIVPIAVTVEGGWFESLGFVHELQFGERLVLLTDIDQSVTDGLYSTDVSAYMYVLVRPGTTVAAETVTAGVDSESANG